MFIQRRNALMAATLFTLATAGVATLAAGGVPPRGAALANRTVVQASFDAWAAGTGSPFDLLAEDASWTIEGNSAASRRYLGKETFLREVIRPFNARMTVGIKPAVRSITAEADRVVILFDARGTARDGKPYINSYAWFFQMRNGRVVNANAFFDAPAFDDLWTRVRPTE